MMEAHLINAANGAPLGAKARGAQAHLVVFDVVDDDARHHAAPLADDGGKRRTRHAHGRKAQKAENHDGVEDDIHDGARHLADHLIHCFAGGLQDALEGDLHKAAQAQHRHDAHIHRAACGYLRHLCEHIQKPGAAHRAEGGKGEPCNQRDKHAVCRHLFSGGIVLFAKPAR